MEYLREGAGLRRVDDACLKYDYSSYGGIPMGMSSLCSRKQSTSIDGLVKEGTRRPVKTTVNAILMQCKNNDYGGLF